MLKQIQFLLRTPAASIIFISVGFFCLYAFYSGFSYYCDSMCANRMLSSMEIDGTDLKIVVFERDCGATTSFSTQASILPAKESLANTSGNVFRADANHGAAPTGPGGGPVLRVKVTGPGNIELSYHPDIRIFLAEKKFKRVHIRYSLITDR
jgi:hypothetical protein